MYWPRMNEEVKEFILRCEVCRVYQDKKQKEPMIGHDIPSRPWQKVGSDLFELQNGHFLVCVDYYSDFIEVGPPYNSKEFAEFSKEYKFEHKTSSPRYPQSNGKAENAVKIAKNILQRANYARSDPNLALLAYRNTPTEGVGSSPAQRLFGRRRRTLLPTSDMLLKPKTVRHMQKKLEGRKNREKFYYDRGAKDLKELRPGDVVRIKIQDKDKEWVKAKVAEKVNPRSYKARTEDGMSYRRNRRHVMETKQKFNDKLNEYPTSKKDTGSKNTINERKSSQFSKNTANNENTVNNENANTTTVAAEQHINNENPKVITTRSGRTVRRPQYYQA